MPCIASLALSFLCKTFSCHLYSCLLSVAFLILPFLMLPPIASFSVTRTRTVKEDVGWNQPMGDQVSRPEPPSLSHLQPHSVRSKWSILYWLMQGNNTIPFVQEELSLVHSSWRQPWCSVPSTVGLAIDVRY